MSYDRYDAMADAADDAWNDLLSPRLNELVQPVMDRVEELADEIEEHGDTPHPWTWERFLIDEFGDDDEDLREFLEEHFMAEAVETAEEDAYNSTPCCNSFDCPCGNANNYPG